VHLIEGRRPLYQDKIQRPVRFPPTIKILLDPPSNQSRARCKVPALQLEVTSDCLRGWPKSSLKLMVWAGKKNRMALVARCIYGLRLHPCGRFMSHSTWLAFVLELNILDAFISFSR